MKVSELIKKLQELQNQVGDVDVIAYSSEYCCDLHIIQDVSEGYWDGWREHNDVIGICITK